MNKEFKPFRIKDHLKKDSSVQVFYNEGLYAYKPAIFTNPIIKPNPKSDWNLEAIMEKGIPDEVPGALMFAWNVRKRNLNQIEREVPEEILENRIKAWIAGYAVGAVSHTSGLDRGFAPKPDYRTALAAIDVLIGFDKLPNLTKVVQKIVHGYFGLPKK